VVILCLGKIGEALNDGSPLFDEPQRHQIRQVILVAAAHASKDADEYVRRFGGEALVKTSPDSKQAVETLIVLLGDPVPGVRGAAAHSLGELGPAAASAVDALVPMLEDEAEYWHAFSHNMAMGESVGRTVARVLGEIGPPAKPAVSNLLAILKSRPGDTDIIEALGRIGAKEALPTLEQGLTDKKTRIVAARAVLRIDSNHRAATAVICQAVESKKRPWALPTFVELCLRREDAARVLTARYADGWPSAVAEGLGRLGADAKPAVPELVRAVKAGKDDVACAAVRALGDIGPSAAPAAPALIAELKNYRCDDEALAALVKIGPPAVSCLTKMLDSPDDRERIAAAGALGQIGPPAAEAVPKLLDSLNDPNHEIRAAAAEALGQMDTRVADVAAQLIARLDDPRMTVRRAAAEALGKLGATGPQSRDRLSTLLDDEYAAVRRAASTALGVVTADK
jgi:HEAT repeat protein